MSIMITSWGSQPAAISNLTVAMLAAPDPNMTILLPFKGLSVTLSALNRPARVTPAVPCWSSCQTGMFISALSLSRISKHFGDSMSSRLIPPSEGSSVFTTLMNCSGSWALIGTG